MGGVGISLAKRESRKHIKINSLQKRKHIQEQDDREITTQVELQSSSSSPDSDGNSAGPSSKKPCYEGISAGPSHLGRTKQVVRNVWTPGLTSALDRTGTTDRNALFIISETIRSIHSAQKRAQT